MRRGINLAAAFALALGLIASTVEPARAVVIEARYTLVSYNRTSVTWLADPATSRYDVYVNGDLARSIDGKGNVDVTLGRVLGPADTVEIATSDAPSTRVKATYWSNAWVDFPNLVVRFSSKSTSLNAEAKRKIATFAGIIERHGFLRVRAIGHDAGVAGAPGSYALGQARAAAVMQQLQKAVDVDGVVSSWGNTYPVSTNATAAGQAENRRVELTLR